MNHRIQIEKLMKELSLGEVLEAPVAIKGGLLHKMYRVVTSEGAFAVKLLNDGIMKRPEALRNMIYSEKAAALFSKDIPAAVALERNGRQVHLLDGDFYMVFRWVDGASVFPGEINEKHCAAIGTILGKMHQRNIRCDGMEPEEEAVPLYDWESFLWQAKEQKARTEAWVLQYEAAVPDIRAWNQEAYDAQDILARRLVISHRDLDPKNVMWSGMEPIIIDWEAAGYVNPYQELSEVIHYWADDGQGGLHRSFFEAIVKAYEKHMDLSKAEWTEVFAGGSGGMLGWLEYNLKRALGEEASGEEEVRLGEEQVRGTIKELYAYRTKTEQIRSWLKNTEFQAGQESGNDRYIDRI